MFEIDGQNFEKVVLYWASMAEDGFVPYIEDVDHTRHREGTSRWGEPFEATEAARVAAERRVAAYGAMGITAYAMSQYEASERAAEGDALNYGV